MSLQVVTWCRHQDKMTTLRTSSTTYRQPRIYLLSIRCQRWCFRTDTGDLQEKSLFFSWESETYFDASNVIDVHGRRYTSLLRHGRSRCHAPLGPPPIRVRRRSPDKGLGLEVRTFAPRREGGEDLPPCDPSARLFAISIKRKKCCHPHTI